MKKTLSKQQNEYEAVIFDESFYENIAKELPAVIPRKRMNQFLGGLFSSATMRSFDNKGEGPPSVKIGAAVVYERDSFIEWLKQRQV